MLGNLLVLSSNSPGTFNRPDYGLLQVKSRTQLKPGTKYFLVNNTTKVEFLFTVINNPEYVSATETWFVCVAFESKPDEQKLINLSDCCVEKSAKQGWSSCGYYIRFIS